MLEFDKRRQRTSHCPFCKAFVIESRFKRWTFEGYIEEQIKA